MKRLKKDFTQFIVMLLSLAIMLGVGYSVPVIPENTHMPAEQTLAAEALDETDEPDLTEEIVLAEENNSEEAAILTEETTPAEEEIITEESAPAEEKIIPEKSVPVKEITRESTKVIYDPQPTTLEEVQSAIGAYETKYQSVLAAEGFTAAIEVPKPRWQYEVGLELMPKGYNCQLVDWDEDFGAEYYTFFSNPATTDYGQGRFLNKPETGPNITTVFTYLVGDTQVDSTLSNVAIATLDNTYQFGAMWANQKLDLSMPFSTEMYLHLGHSVSPADSRAVADGMTFTMHNYEDALTTMIGGKGEGLGVWMGRSSGVEHGSYLPNSLVIEFDTYINNDRWSTVSDPVSADSVKYAHCALIYPRANNASNPISRSEHKNTYYFQPTQKWIPFTVNWEPEYDEQDTLGGTLTYSFEGEKEVEKIDDVESVFGGTEVWWGFTGATGEQTSLQAAAIVKLPIQYGVDVVKSVENENEEEIDGEYAYPGETLTYTIRVTGKMTDGGDPIGPVSIEDKLSEYLEYDGGDVTITMGDGSVEPFTRTPDFDKDTNTLSLDTGCYLQSSEDWMDITFTVKVKEYAEVDVDVENTAAVEVDNIEGAVESNTTVFKIGDASRKTVASYSAAGAFGAAVTIGNEITYKIRYVNNSDMMANLVITDVLPEGLEYCGRTDTESHTGNGGVYYESTNTVVWPISGVEAGEDGSVTVTVKVKLDIDLEAIDNKLINTAQVQWSNGNTEELSTKNPVYGYKAIYDGNGGVIAPDDMQYVEDLLQAGGDYTVLGNNETGFTRNGYTFLSWNTQSDGSGDEYHPGDIFEKVMSDITLYAQWGKDLVFRKIDAKSVGNEAITPLPGAGFELYECRHVHDDACGGVDDPSACIHMHIPLEQASACWGLSSYTASYDADDQSIVTFSGLTDGGYLIMETTAPDGYQLPKGQWIVEVESDEITFIGTSGDSNIPAVVAKTNFNGKETDSSVDFWIGNITQYELPTLGKEGTACFVTMGILLLLCGLLAGILYRRGGPAKRGKLM